MIEQPRDENGQFVSLTTLFERERTEHERDHENERLVARETAQRLEREVEQTAVRLERAVEETAARLEKGVDTALRAVAATASVHAEAHSREHVAHERIHSVEKAQVDKADVQRDRDAQQLANQLREFKAASNEWRGALIDQRASLVTRDLFDIQDKRIQQIERRMAYYAGAAAAGGASIGALFQYVL